MADAVSFNILAETPSGPAAFDVYIKVFQEIIIYLLLRTGESIHEG